MVIMINDAHSLGLHRRLRRSWQRQCTHRK